MYGFYFILISLFSELSWVAICRYSVLFVHGERKMKYIFWVYGEFFVVVFSVHFCCCFLLLLSVIWMFLSLMPAFCARVWRERHKTMGESSYNRINTQRKNAYSSLPFFSSSHPVVFLYIFLLCRRFARLFLAKLCSNFILLLLFVVRSVYDGKCNLPFI